MNRRTVLALNAAVLAVSDHRPIWAVFDMDGPDDDGDVVTAVVQARWGG